MKNILKELSKKAIELGDFEFTQEQINSKWLGSQPATDEEIAQTEKRLGIELPNDYKKFLSITNGFAATNNIEPTFEKIKKIDYLKNVDSFLVELWSNQGSPLAEVGEQLSRSIIIAGISAEQSFLLIPPKNISEEWKYWKWAFWHPGEVEYENLESYFKNVLNFTNEQIENE